MPLVSSLPLASVERVARGQGVVVAGDGGVVLQRHALVGFVQHDLQAIGLAALLAVGAQKIDQGLRSS